MTSGMQSRKDSWLVRIATAKRRAGKNGADARVPPP
jgi:hypothetical protein